MAEAIDVFPNDAVRSPFAHGALLFLGLRDDLGRAELIEFLIGLSSITSEVTADFEGHRLASVTVGLAPSFFNNGAGPRFELDGDQTPSCFAALPALPQGCAPAGGDLVVYLVTTAEAVFAQFLQGIARLHTSLKSVEVERGFQRANRRELGGFLDGLRNPTVTNGTVFVDRNKDDEAVWTDGGTYTAYLKIQQDLDRWNGLDQPTQEAAIGRRRDDGSRLDLPAGTPVATEGEFGDGCPATAHIRKVGPRGQSHDETTFLRRGLPFVELTPDATQVAGLQFVSFQATLDIFDTIFNRWMNNPDFMAPATGPDALLTSQGLTFLKGGFYFVPPHDDRHIGAGLFDPHVARCRNVGHILVRKKIRDANGPVRAELGGIGFQVFLGDQAIGDVFRTNSHGHARSPEVPIGQDLVLREVDPPANLTPAGDTPVKLDCPSITVTIENTITQPGSGYGG